jgi:hypothetical protein
METYFYEGKREDDSFTIRWKDKKMMFEDLKPDNPLWTSGL